MLFQFLDGIYSWEDKQCDFAASGFAFNVVHHRHGARSSADDQTTTLPGDLLFDRHRRMPEFVAKFLRGLFLTLTDVSAVNHHIMLIRHAVDTDGAKRKLLEAHNETELSAHSLEHHHRFAYAVTMFQVSIALAAVAALSRQKAIWLVGLMISMMGIVYFLDGFWLFF